MGKAKLAPNLMSNLPRTLSPPSVHSFFRGQKKPHKKKTKFLGTEVPRNFSDQCSLDFAYFLCLFSGRRAKKFPGTLFLGTFFFLILGGFSPSDFSQRHCYNLFQCSRN